MVPIKLGNQDYFLLNFNMVEKNKECNDSNDKINSIITYDWLVLIIKVMEKWLAICHKFEMKCVAL